jgi:hypothetical protein
MRLASVLSAAPPVKGSTFAVLFSTTGGNAAQISARVYFSPLTETTRTRFGVPFLRFR